jgi:hypothetical protein
MPNRTSGAKILVAGISPDRGMVTWLTASSRYNVWFETTDRPLVNALRSRVPVIAIPGSLVVAGLSGSVVGLEPT